MLQNRKARTRPKDERTGVRTTKSDMTRHRRTGQDRKTGQDAIVL